MAEPMTVRELIVALMEMPQDKRLEVQDIENSCDVLRVFDQGDVVVIECGEEFDEEA